MKKLANSQKMALKVTLAILSLSVIPVALSFYAISGSSPLNGQTAQKSVYPLILLLVPIVSIILVATSMYKARQTHRVNFQPTEIAFWCLTAAVSVACLGLITVVTFALDKNI